MPAIFCDIDGVVLKGLDTPILIGNSKAQIRRILRPSSKGPVIPFTFLTNGGMETE